MRIQMARGELLPKAAMLSEFLFFNFYLVGADMPASQHMRGGQRTT